MALSLRALAMLAMMMAPAANADAKPAQGVLTCGPAKGCKKFSDIYKGGKDLCEVMWGNAFKYETDEAKGFTMAAAGVKGNAAVADSLAALAHVAKKERNMCHLAYFHHDGPPVANNKFGECKAYEDLACCKNTTVASANKLKLGYGKEYLWDRCGPLSAKCEAYFVEEACFYECEPAAGHYRRFPSTPQSSNADHKHTAYDPRCDKYNEAYNKSLGCAHNTWEMYRMPIKASYCDGWFEACKDDLFCGGGDYFSCAAQFKQCDDAKGAKGAKADAATAAQTTAAPAEAPAETKSAKGLSEAPASVAGQLWVVAVALGAALAAL